MNEIIKMIMVRMYVSEDQEEALEKKEGYERCWRGVGS